MNRNATVSILAAATLLASCAQKPPMQASAAPQPTPTRMVCNLQWCPVYVVVSTNSGTPAAMLQWDEVAVQPSFSDGVLLWTLNTPDYEFRSNSIAATGTNAAGARAEFPVRQISDTRFALDALNRNNLTYTYEVRVYRKGAPADATPLVARGTVVNVGK